AESLGHLVRARNRDVLDGAEDVARMNSGMFRRAIGDHSGRDDVACVLRPKNSVVREAKFLDLLEVNNSGDRGGDCRHREERCRKLELQILKHTGPSAVGAHTTPSSLL